MSYRWPCAEIKEAVMSREKIIDSLESGSDVIVFICGAWVFGIGVAFLAAPETMQTASGVFAQAEFAPWWAWGGWAVVAGLVTLVRPARRFGLAAGLLWFSAWGAIVGRSGFSGATAFYVVPHYLGVVATWTLITGVIWHIDRLRAGKAGPF